MINRSQKVLGWLIAGLTLALCVRADVPANLRLTIVATPSSVFDTRYRDGDDGSAAVPCTWSTIPDVSVFSGSSYSLDLRQYLDEPGSSALSIFSGALPSGWSLGADSIDYSGTGTGTGSIVIDADCGSQNAQSNVFTVLSETPPPTDTAAPTIPRGCVGTGGSGSVAITCDASSDAYTDLIGTGVASYKIRLGGTLVNTLTATYPNVQPQLTQTVIGASDGTPTNTQDGPGRVLSFAGAGLSSTSDNILFLGTTVATDFLASATFNSFTTSITTDNAGLMVRASAAVDAPYAACRVRKSDNKVNLRYRSTTGGAAANGTLTAAQSLPVHLKLVGTAATGYQCLVSTDGNTWAATQDPVAISMGATPIVGVYHTSGTAATNSTSDLDEINIVTTPAISYTHSTSTGGSYTVSAVDVNGNESAQGTAFTATPTGGVATLDFVDTFTSTTWPPNTANWGTTSDSCTTYRLFTNEVVKDAPYAFKAGVGQCFFGDNYVHSMLVLRGGQSFIQNFTPGVEFYIGFSVYPLNFTTGATGDIVSQCHGTNEGNQVNPSCTLNIQNGRWVFRIVGDTDNFRPSDRSASYDCGAVVNNAWNDIVFRFTFGDAASGRFTVWVGGVKCGSGGEYTDTGINWYTANSYAPNIHFGLYSQMWVSGTTDSRPDGITSRTLYIDQVRVGRSINGVGYSDVVPR